MSDLENPSRFEHLLFVCQKERDPENPKGSCFHAGGPELLDRMKELTAEHKLKGRVRVTAAGCLDFCAQGSVVMALSKDPKLGETWYTCAKAEDADELFASHVLRGEPLERLKKPIKAR